MPTAPNQADLAALQSKVDLLKTDPTNVKLRTLILQGQQTLTANQLGVTPAQAGAAVRTFTAAYATTKNIDPQALLDSLSVEEQHILDYSQSNPTLYGVDLITAQKIAGYLGLGSGLLLAAAITIFTVALFTVGPEAAAAIAASEGVVGAISAIIGSPLIATGGFLFLLSQFLGHLSTGIPMMTKQMIDNGSIGPGLRITALTQAQQLEAKLTGGNSPGPYTASEFTNLAVGLEANGVTGINDPKTKTVIAYSRASLAALVQYLYGQAILNGAPHTPSKITPQITAYLLFPAGKSAPAASGAVTPPAAVSIPQVKVFTGIVSAGKLADTPTFTPRTSDLIETVAQLKDAAQNNLAVFYQSLAGLIAYEVKIVPSVITKDGFKQTGGSQSVKTGTNKAGIATYKTVFNKFATLNIYALTEKGTRTKIKTIVLGPTNSATLHPSTNEVTTLETNIKDELFTTNVADISTVETSAPLSIVPPTTSAPAAPIPASAPVVQGTKPALTTTGLFTAQGDYGNYIYEIDGRDIIAYPLTRTTNSLFSPALGGIPEGNAATIAAAAIERLKKIYGLDWNALPVKFLDGNIYLFNPDMINRAKANNNTVVFYGREESVDTLIARHTPGAAATNTVAARVPAVCTSGTLFDFYQAQGLTLPSVADRSTMYASMGLGEAAYYTGTAEQNVKLLTELQRRSGC